VKYKVLMSTNDDYVNVEMWSAGTPDDGEMYDAYIMNPQNNKLMNISLIAGNEIKVKVFTQIPDYTVTVEANPSNGGTVTGGGTYPGLTRVELSATPNTNFGFINWTGNETKTDAEFYFTLYKDTTWTANFLDLSTLNTIRYTATNKVTPNVDSQYIYSSDFNAETGQGVLRLYPELNNNGGMFSENGDLLTLDLSESTFTHLYERFARKCLNLSSVTFNNLITVIDPQAFRESGLSGSLTIPDSVEIINSDAFNACTNLTSLTIGNSVQSIGNSAFKACTNLTEIVIPASISSIGDSAFIGCTIVTLVTCLSESPVNITIGTQAFPTEWASQTKLYVPKGYEPKYKAAGWNTYFQSIVELPE
jgi:hypothetical protein